VRAAGPERLDLSRIGDLVVASRNGQAIPVSQVARIAFSSEEPIVWRKNRELILTVRSDVAEGMQPPDVTTQLIQALKPLENALPAGYRFEPGGAYEESGKANAALYSLFPAMILVMLALIMVQMQSFSRMFLVFATFPLGLIGAVLALLISQQPFGFVALLGVIALGGMIMRNTLILADQIDQDLKAGHTMREAIVESTIRRARPVVLTAIAAAFAFVPLATNVFWGPLAVALIGGLAVATALTLIALPALYALWFRVPRNAADDKRPAPKTEPTPEGYAVAAE
jgi:multidrug efflux pump subunit AcrB